MRLRRTVSSTGSLVALLVVLAASMAAAGDQRIGLAGTWTQYVDFNFIVDPDHPDQTVKFYLAGPMSVTSDGRVIQVLPTGAGHPNVGDTRVACLGEWRPAHHPREFDLLVKCMYNQAWDGVYAEIRGPLRLSADGRRFTWTFSYIDFNADGSIYYDEGRGVSHGKRLEF